VAVATEVRRTIEHYRELQDVISLLGIEELGAEDRCIVQRARRLQRFLTQPFAVTEAFSGLPGRSVAVADTIAGCKAILAGECDDWQESSLYLVGTTNRMKRVPVVSDRRIVGIISCADLVRALSAGLDKSVAEARAW